MTRRVLVAGVGNVFLGDDAFGVEVVRRLAGTDLPAGIEVADFGIRGVHLAYQLLDGYDVLILVDAAPRGGAPGSLYVIEPDRVPPPAEGEVLVDAHGMQPESVLRLLDTLGGTSSVERVVIVGCEPACVAEEMGLSEPVTAAVSEAVRLVAELARGAVEDDGNDGRRNDDAVQTGVAGAAGPGGGPGGALGRGRGHGSIHTDAPDVNPVRRTAENSYQEDIFR